MKEMKEEVLQLNKTPYPLKKAGGGINIGFFRGRARRIKRRMQVLHHEHEE